MDSIFVTGSCAVVSAFLAAVFFKRALKTVVKSQEQNVARTIVILVCLFTLSFGAFVLSLFHLLNKI